MTSIFGILTFSALIHGPVETVPQVAVILIGLGTVGFLFYFKKWTWLYKNCSPASIIKR